MTFWMGFIVGLGGGAVLCSVFYTWLLRLALQKRSNADDVFQEIQRRNGEHIGRIANAIEKHLG